MKMRQNSPLQHYLLLNEITRNYSLAKTKNNDRAKILRAFETEALVPGDRARGAAVADHGDDQAVVKRRASRNQLAEHSFADALAMADLLHVNRILQREAVCGVHPVDHAVAVAQ